VESQASGCTFNPVIQEQTQSLYLTSPSGELFTNPFFLLATCFAAKPPPVAPELPMEGGGSVEVWISPDPMRQFASPYVYSPNPVNSIDPDGRFSISDDFAKNYPKSTAALNSIAINAKKEGAYLKYGFASPRQVRLAFKNGTGPNVDVGVFPGGQFGVPAMGKFDPDNPNTVSFDLVLLMNVEDGKVGAKELLQVSAQHEVTHFFENKYNGNKSTVEEGWQYEKAVWGKSIKNYTDAQCLDEP
jgi:hypothetical protein